MGDLVIVSNRGPFSFSEGFFEEAKACLKTGVRPKDLSFGEGGLVQAMAGLLKPGNWRTTWLGASMGDRDIDVARGHYTGLFRKMVKRGYAPEDFPRIEIDSDDRMHFRYKEYDFYMRFVFFDTKHMHSYYNKFANGFLWPLMHLTSAPLFYTKAKAFPRPHFEKNDFVQYISSGVTFANVIIDEIRKSKEFREQKRDIVIWNQDYHLMRIAEVCKALLLHEEFSEEEMRRIHVGQFLHTPFFDIHEIQSLIRADKRRRVKGRIYDPFPESIETALQKLTWGMLANDFIGFHTKEYCDNYLEALEEWFPVDIRVAEKLYEITHQDHVTTVGAFPIGLDVEKILTEVSRDKILECEVKGESLYGRIVKDKEMGRYVFGGLERCDYTKGLLERLNIAQYAFQKLKSFGKDARFYQVTAPSRLENPDYQNLYNFLNQEVTKVNRKLGMEQVIHIDEGVSSPQNYRFMKEVDVMFVTPLEDGMNLVAFEYILSQKYKHPGQRGILVLGKSGASRVLRDEGFGEMDGIIYVNAMKPKDAGERTAEALRSGRHLSEKMIRYVERERRVDTWAERNIQAILSCRKTP